MLNHLITQLPTKSNLEKLYALLTKLSKDADDPDNVLHTTQINDYLSTHKVKFIDLTGKNIAGNSVQVIGWEHNSGLPQDKEICYNMLKPAIKVDTEWTSYGQCIGAVNNPKLLERNKTKVSPTIVISSSVTRVSVSDITRDKKLQSTSLDSAILPKKTL